MATLFAHLSDLTTLLAGVDLTRFGGSLASIEWIGRIVSCFFLFAFGACVGSFLNVVVYRIPAGLSVVTPPSRCPTCGGRLTWRENMPVLGWLLLRGRCRFCRQPISIQYPLIETLVGAAFVALYVLFFLLPTSAMIQSGQSGAVGSSDGFGLASLVLPWWKAQGFALSWPLFVAILFMLAGLLAATLIDARHYIIPGEITWTMAGFGIAGVLTQSFLPVAARARALEPPLESVGTTTAAMAVGGAVGLLIATALLKTGVLRYSYADFDEHVKEDDPLSSYPHARRETLREIVFLLPIVIGALVGWAAGHWIAGGEPAHVAELPHWFGMLAASVWGYLIGGTILWAVRVFGTLGFGREAMGLGDVHLLAAVGTVLGWKGAVWTFVLTLPVSLGYALLAFCLRPFIRLPIRELPLGPHLAVASVLTLLLTPTLRSFDPALGDIFSNAWQGMLIKLGWGP